MTRRLAAALLASALSAGPCAAQAVFDKPGSDRVVTAPGLTIHCASYARFMVRDVRQGDDIGTASVSVAAPGETCGAEMPATGKELPGNEHMDVAGVLGRFLVLMWPDGANGATSFAVFDGVVGRKLYSDVVKLDGLKRVALTGGGDTLELRFVRVLTLPCSVVAGGAGCWGRAARELKLPGEVARRAAPVAACAAGYAEGKKPPADDSVVGYEVGMTIAAGGGVSVSSRGALVCWGAE